MTTTQQTDCTAVTDSQGVSLIPGTTNLRATGVTLSGTGCGGSGGSGQFQAQINVPATATVGQSFNVGWSASAAATKCVYGGTSGLTGWTVGGNACSGSQCAGSHTVPVTVNAQGSYTLSVTCTDSSGFADGSGTTFQGPPTPDGFSLTAPGTASTGTAFSVSWTVDGATSCTGSADLGGSSVSLSGWTDVTTATSPRSVTATQAGTYTLKLTCSNAQGSATSQPVTVDVGAGDTCPAGRYTVATIRYPNIPGTPQRLNVDLTQYDNIWGHMNATDSVTSWPGVNGTQPAILNWNRTQYVAAKFHVPANVDTHLFGFLGYGTYYSGPQMTLAISHTCGDFAPSDSLCVSTRDAGSSFRRWVVQPYTNGCQLTPNTDYYVNIKMADPATTGCGGTGVCSGIAINNTLGTQP